MIKEFLQRMGILARTVPSALKAAPAPAPHEQYPEIMHWQEGDEIRATRFWFSLISITAGGMVYGNNVTNDHKFGEPLWMVIRDGQNLSLNDRQIDEALKATNEYMELIRQFNAAFEELRERDRHIRLAS